MRTSIGPVVLGSLALVATALGAVGACTPRPPSSPPIVTAAAATPGAPGAQPTATDAPAAPASTIVEGPPRPAPRCRLTVTETEGCQPNQVEQLVAPARSQIEHCRGASGGRLTVRVRRAPSGRLAFDAAPGTSLDPTEKKCVLDALNGLPVSESGTAYTGGPSFPPTGFSSLLTIEW